VKVSPFSSLKVSLFFRLCAGPLYRSAYVLTQSAPLEVNLILFRFAMEVGGEVYLSEVREKVTSFFILDNNFVLFIVTVIHCKL
jgi:hypothetical protein